MCNRGAAHATARSPVASRTPLAGSQAAARSGQLEELKALRADSWPWDRDTCSAAALGGHLEVLQWAHANGCLWDIRTCHKAAEGGYLKVILWARANGCPCAENEL
jgi:hypothetical protein